MCLKAATELLKMMLRLIYAKTQAQICSPSEVCEQVTNEFDPVS